MKADDQGIGAFRAAQTPEQKPTIGPKFTDDDPWAEPVTAGDTLTGATSQDAYNNANVRHNDNTPSLRRRTDVPAEHGD